MANRYTFSVDIAGVGHRQEVARACHAGQAVTLERDPHNPDDGNAIRVMAGRRQLGFVPRDHAVDDLAPMLDSGDWVVEARIDRLVRGEVVIRGEPTVGVRLQITYYRKPDD